MRYICLPQRESRNLKHVCNAGLMLGYSLYIFSWSVSRWKLFTSVRRWNQHEQYLSSYIRYCLGIFCFNIYQGNKVLFYLNYAIRICFKKLFIYTVSYVKMVFINNDVLICWRIIGLTQTHLKGIFKNSKRARKCSYHRTSYLLVFLRNTTTLSMILNDYCVGRYSFLLYSLESYV